MPARKVHIEDEEDLSMMDDEDDYEEGADDYEEDDFIVQGDEEGDFGEELEYGKRKKKARSCDDITKSLNNIREKLIQKAGPAVKKTIRKSPYPKVKQCKPKVKAVLVRSEASMKQTLSDAEMIAKAKRQAAAQRRSIAATKKSPAKVTKPKKTVSKAKKAQKKKVVVKTTSKAPLYADDLSDSIYLDAIPGATKIDRSPVKYLPIQTEPVVYNMASRKSTFEPKTSDELGDILIPKEFGKKKKTTKRKPVFKGF